jgi:hypothetical protein
MIDSSNVLLLKPVGAGRIDAVSGPDPQSFAAPARASQRLRVRVARFETTGVSSSARCLRRSRTSTGSSIMTRLSFASAHLAFRSVVDSGRSQKVTDRCECQLRQTTRSCTGHGITIECRCANGGYALCQWPPMSKARRPSRGCHGCPKFRSAVLIGWEIRWFRASMLMVWCGEPWPRSSTSELAPCPTCWSARPASRSPRRRPSGSARRD